jgi:hypothetical protein
MKKYAVIAVSIVLAVIFTFIGISSISYKSRTRDESRHLIRGVMLLETGDYRLNKHHPVLANVLNAVPVLFIDDVDIPDTDSDLWDRAAKDELAEEIVDINGGGKPFVMNILNPARAVTTIFIASSLIILAVIIRKEWGTLPAIVFSILYAFSPNIIAHARLVTTDVWIVPFIFLGTYLLYRYVTKPSRTLFIIFIIVSFLSLITKYSAVPIAALWLLLLFAFEFKRHATDIKQWRKRIVAALAKPAIAAGSWALLLFATYGFRFSTLAATNHADTARTQAHLDNLSGIADPFKFLIKPLQNAYLHTPLPFPEYVQGFFENVILHDVYGHDSFLFGMYAKYGWWYYFPASMLVKMPVPALIGLAALFAVAVFIFIKWIQKLRSSGSPKKVLKNSLTLKPDHIWFIIPVFFMALSIKSSINLGMRHILPILPFIYLGIALLVKKTWERHLISKATVIILGIWYIFSAISVYPHYLEYFNEMAGGPKNGYRYLLDSNLSWGQNAFLVQDYIRDLPEGTTIHVNPHEPHYDGLVLYDVDLLMGRDQGKRNDTAWMREPFLAGDIEPIDRIANTHLVFDVENE